MMHAVCEERKQYGAIGWNCAYDFTEADLRISVAHVKTIAASSGHTSFSAIQYLVSEVNYGGKITDDYDRRLIGALCSDYLCERAMKPNYKYTTASSRSASRMKREWKTVSVGVRNKRTFLRAFIPQNTLAIKRYP